MTAPRGLSSAQLLSVADRVGAEFHATVHDLAAIAACAATTTAEINGIPVHGSAEQAAESLVHSIRRLSPLNSANEEFADVAALVLLELNRAD